MASVYWREKLSISSTEEWGVVLGWRSDNLIICSKLLPLKRGNVYENEEYISDDEEIKDTKPNENDQYSFTNDTYELFRKHFMKTMDNPCKKESKGYVSKQSTTSFENEEIYEEISTEKTPINNNDDPLLELVPVGFYCHRLIKPSTVINYISKCIGNFETDIFDLWDKNSLYTIFQLQDDIPLPIYDIFINWDSFELLTLPQCNYLVVIYPFLNRMQSLSCTANIADVPNSNLEPEEHRMSAAVSFHLKGNSVADVNTDSFALFWILTILNQVNFITHIDKHIILERIMYKVFYFFNNNVIMVSLFLFIKFFAMIILRVLNFTVINATFINRIRGFLLLDKSQNLKSSHKLKHMSITLQQISLRLEQLITWPKEFQNWQNTNEKLSQRAQRQYIGFYNFIWLTINDIVFGIPIGRLLILNNEFIAGVIGDSISKIGIEYMRGLVIWLMGYPAGLKLNSELTSVFGQIFLILIDLWSDYVKIMISFMPIILVFIGYSGCFGVSVIIALLSDLMSICTLHLHLFYLVAFEIYTFQVSSMLSLINLFTGKRRNIKNNVDIVNYDLDQLLLGSVSFTILVFLYPTTAVYYFLFTIARVILVSSQLIIEAILRLINLFPLFSLMLYIKDPKRIPGGIYFETIGNSKMKNKFISSEIRKFRKANPNVTYLILNSKPLSITEIFYQYRFVLAILRKTYFSSNILMDIICGRLIKRVPNVEYDMLPNYI